jgi:hypothetical protein
MGGFEVNKEEFDRLFDTAFEEAVHTRLAAPDPSTSWSNVERRLRSRSKRRTVYKLLPSVVASFILGAVIFGSPAVTQAFDPIVQSIKEMQAGVVTLVFGRQSSNDTKAKTPPPPDGPVATEGAVLDSGSLEHKHYATWEEASGHTDFSSIKINYVAKDFELSDAFLSVKSGEKIAKIAVISYANRTSNKSYRVRLRWMEKGEILTSSNDKNAGKLEEVKINGQPAYLFTTTDDRRSLEYLLGNLYVAISGGLTSDEIVHVGENIKW